MSDWTPPLLGQTAVITGGGGGIGRATASVLVGHGAHVLLAGRTAATLEEAASSLKADAERTGGSVRWTEVDALDEAQVKALVELTAEPTGRVDMAVAVVGGGGGSVTPVLRYSVEVLEGTLHRNITSAFLLLKYAGSAMVRGGGGSFVAVSSMQAIQSAPMFAAYCASKAGLEMFCKVAADELGQYKVRVNVVRPGLTRTGGTGALIADPQVVEAYLEQQPIAQTGEPENIAWAIRYFLGPEAEWTTGQSLTVDGGTTIRRFPDISHFWESRLGDDVKKQALGIVD